MRRAELFPELRSMLRNIPMHPDMFDQYKVEYQDNENLVQQLTKRGYFAEANVDSADQNLEDLLTFLEESVSLEIEDGHDEADLITGEDERESDVSDDCSSMGVSTPKKQKLSVWEKLENVEQADLARMDKVHKTITSHISQAEADQIDADFSLRSKLSRQKRRKRLVDNTFLDTEALEEAVEDDDEVELDEMEHTEEQTVNIVGDQSEHSCEPLERLQLENQVTPSQIHIPTSSRQKVHIDEKGYLVTTNVDHIEDTQAEINAMAIKTFVDAVAADPKMRKADEARAARRAFETRVQVPLVNHLGKEKSRLPVRQPPDFSLLTPANYRLPASRTEGPVDIEFIDPTYQQGWRANVDKSEFEKVTPEKPLCQHAYVKRRKEEQDRKVPTEEDKTMEKFLDFILTPRFHGYTMIAYYGSGFDFLYTLSGKLLDMWMCILKYRCLSCFRNS